MRRVLAIDGGGIKGACPAAFLATLEEQVGGNIGEYFDLIVGTSTGGIIALGLASGMSAREILGFYRDHRESIFSLRRTHAARTAHAASRWLPAWLSELLWAGGRVSGPVYDNSALRSALDGVFRDRLLGSCARRVVIPTQSLETGRVYVYKTPHHDRLRTDWRRPIVEVALATSAAPLYFPAVRAESGPLLIDGGTWANNPASVAAVEAVGIAMLAWDPRETRLLSLGCTTPPLDAPAAQAGDGGISPWLLKSTDVIFAAQSSASLGMAQLLLGHSNVKRYSPTVPPGKFALDDFNGFDSLVGLAAEEARHAIPELGEMFFGEKADPFVAPEWARIT